MRTLRLYPLIGWDTYNVAAEALGQELVYLEGGTPEKAKLTELGLHSVLRDLHDA